MFEYEEAALKYAQNVECKDCDATFVPHVGDCKPGELSPGSVDLVLSSHTIEHIARPEDAISDWYELLKPGGLLFMEAPLENPHPLNCATELLDGKVYYGGHISFFTVAHLIKFLENAGFTVFRVETAMGPVNPVLEPEVPISKTFSGQDRLALLIARKPLE